MFESFHLSWNPRFTPHQQEWPWTGDFTSPNLFSHQQKEVLVTLLQGSGEGEMKGVEPGKD